MKKLLFLGAIAYGISMLYKNWEMISDKMMRNSKNKDSMSKEMGSDLQEMPG